MPTGTVPLSTGRTATRSPPNPSTRPSRPARTTITTNSRRASERPAAIGCGPLVFLSHGDDREGVDEAPVVVLGQVAVERERGLGQDWQHPCGDVIGLSPQAGRYQAGLMPEPGPAAQPDQWQRNAGWRWDRDRGTAIEGIKRNLELGSERGR